MENLVEGTFARLLAGGVHPHDIAIRLARALEDSGSRPATHYVVRLCPTDARALLDAEPRLAQILAGELLNLAREAQITLAQPPRVELLPDPDLRPRSLIVSAQAPDSEPAATQGLTPVDPTTAPVRPQAFLILDGERTVVLADTLINLGRRLDNHIVLDDARVSRAHAQLRLRFGHYVIYDLGSTGGTRVNGQRVDECVLQAGDVISLGGVPIIYGEEERSGRAAPAAGSASPASAPSQAAPAGPAAAGPT